MARLIDTSIFIELERSEQGLTVLTLAAPDEAVALASITASELLAGVHRADSVKRRERRATFVEAILGIIPVLPFDLQVARTHAEIWAEMAAAGQMIGAHDLLIAATALTHNYAVLTHNLRDFQRVPGLVIHQPSW
jgi:predicted nucleic acid-binding protein